MLGGRWRSQQNMFSCRQSYGIPSALLDLSSDRGREIGFISSLWLQKCFSHFHAAAAVYIACPERSSCKQRLKQLLPPHPGHRLAEGGHPSPFTAIPHPSR